MIAGGIHVWSESATYPLVVDGACVAAAPPKDWYTRSWWPPSFATSWCTCSTSIYIFEKNLPSEFFWSPRWNTTVSFPVDFLGYPVGIWVESRGGGTDKRIRWDATLYLSIAVVQAVVSLVFRLSLRSYDASHMRPPVLFVSTSFLFSEKRINVSLQVILPIAQKLAPRVVNRFSWRQRILLPPNFWTDTYISSL